MKIILISGYAESGKDTTANILKENLEQQNKKVAILHFAKYIKDYLKDYMGWDGVKNDFWREILQQLGTEVIRERLNMPLFHANRTVEDIKILYELGYEYFIIPDTRFIDEIAYVTANFPYNTVTIRVHRLDYKNSITEKQAMHRSEKDLDNYKFDYNIYVQSGIQHLQDEIERLFKGILF